MFFKLYLLNFILINNRNKLLKVVNSKFIFYFDNVNDAK